MTEELAEIRYDVRTVSFTHPERWWLASRTLLSDLVDPDVDDGAQRHCDRDDIRWHKLGGVLSEVAAALHRGDYRVIDPEAGWITVSITPIPDGLSVQEAGILESWFDHREAPRADAWSTTVKNGRHRIWNVWRHNPTAILPVRSDLLDYAVDVETEHHAQAVRADASSGLQRIPESVHQHSPLYIAQVAIATQVTPRA